MTIVLPAVSAGVAIPKVIHQVYFSKRPPAEIADNIGTIREMNPGWDYRLYDDDDMADYISREYGAEVLGYYERINRRYGASRADLFRYLLLYKEGGVYLDIKSSLRRPLGAVIRRDDVYLLSHWRNAPGETYAGWGKHAALRHLGGQELQQWHIIAAQGHPFLRAVIERVLRNIDAYNPLIQSTGKGGVLRVTGPVAYTKAIKPITSRYPHRFVDSDADLGLVYSIYDGVRSGVGYGHKGIFQAHYTDLREPVAEPRGLTRTLWLTLGPVQNFIRRLRDSLRTARS